MLGFLIGLISRFLALGLIKIKIPEWMKQGMPEHSHNFLEDAKGYATTLRNILNHP